MDTIRVAWKQPPKGEVTGYRLTCTQKDAEEGSDVIEVKVDNPDETRAKFTDLSPGVEYEVKIWTVADDKESRHPVVLKTKTSELDHQRVEYLM